MTLEQQPWMRPSQGLDVECIQAKDEGRDIPFLEVEAEAVRAMPEGAAKETAAADLYRRVQEAPLRAGYPYVEPEDYRAILLACGPTVEHSAKAEKLAGAVAGGWRGRTAGCMLGAPIENWHSGRIQGFLKDTGNWPPTRYLSSDAGPALREKYNVADAPGNYGNPQKPWANLLPGFAPEDDDINYTILALLALEEYGTGLTTMDFAKLWMERLPMLLCCTAERAAYRNLAASVFPPHTAAHCNPYREWIGAQIRADLYGYVSPGRPRQAARLAYVDAALTHTKNGVYGAMWVAAMVALAFVETDMLILVRAAINEIPQCSRLRKALGEVCDVFAAGEGEEAVFGLVHSRYNETAEHDWCHTIPNAMLVAAALLYGEKDFTKTIGLGVAYGFDTDCNAATAGSVLGVMLGNKNIPAHWLEPFNDTVKTGLHGMAFATLSELAARTLKLAGLPG